MLQLSPCSEGSVRHGRVRTLAAFVHRLLYDLYDVAPRRRMIVTNLCSLTDLRTRTFSPTEEYFCSLFFVFVFTVRAHGPLPSIHPLGSSSQISLDMAKSCDCFESVNLRQTCMTESSLTCFKTSVLAWLFTDQIFICMKLCSVILALVQLYLLLNVHNPYPPNVIPNSEKSKSYTL